MIILEETKTNKGALVRLTKDDGFYSVWIHMPECTEAYLAADSEDSHSAHTAYHATASAVSFLESEDPALAIRKQKAMWAELEAIIDEAEED